MGDETYWPADLFEDLDRTGPVPLYHQVASRLEEAVRSGRIPVGKRLENELAISERLALSRPTVRRAIQELVDKGLLVRRRGVGTQVVQGSVTRQVELTSLYDDLDGANKKPTTDVIAFERIPAEDDVATALGIAPGEDVLHISRRRSTAGTPVALMHNYLPTSLVQTDADQLRRTGLYAVMRAQGVTMRVATQRIGARRADDDEAELLGIDDGGPVLTMERIAFGQSGSAVEFGRHAYRPDMYTFETTLVAK